MTEFFRPWRRRFGMLILAVTCLLAIAWVTSLTFNSSVCCSIGKTPTHCFGSIDSSLIWTVDYNRNFSNWPSFSHTRRTDRFRLFNNPFVKWRWRRNGFGIGDTTENQVNYEGMSVYISKSTLTVIPYWSIVTPLTLLSAYLLLSKPRRKPLARPQDVHE